MTDRQDKLTRALALIAPGTAMRDGLERIVHGRTGALVVLGHGAKVDAISTGGFAIDVPFTATALRELAKMDGAIVVDDSLQHILRAAVHLMPDPGCPPTRRAPATGRPTGWRAKSGYRWSRCRRRCRPSPCSSTASGTWSNAPTSSCRGPTRPSPPWPVTAAG